MKPVKAKEASKSFRELIEWELSRDQRPTFQELAARNALFGSALRKRFNAVVQPLEGALKKTAGWGRPSGLHHAGQG